MSKAVVRATGERMCREIRFFSRDAGAKANRVYRGGRGSRWRSAMCRVTGAQSLSQQCGRPRVPLRGLIRAPKPTAYTAAAGALDQARPQTAVW